MQIQPELFVADLDRSLAFYRDVLGFRILRQEASGFTELAQGDATLALNRLEVLGPDHPIRPSPGEPLGRGVELVLFVDDVAALHHDVAAKGWPLSTALTDQPWGMTDFRVLDPDGYYLRISGRKRQG